MCTGYQSGEPLRQLYQNAAAFVLSSSHEGLSIAILEALSFGLPVIASDIPGNIAVGLDASSYYPVGDVAALAQHLRAVTATRSTSEERDARRAFVAEHYSWSEAAAETVMVYREAMGQPALRLVHSGTGEPF